MVSTLLFVALVSVIAYFATYKLNRRLRVAIALGTFTLLGALPIVFVLLNQDRVACWAYSDQCAEDRVLGLSSSDCLARDDAVAYLQEGGVCVVRREEIGRAWGRERGW